MLRLSFALSLMSLAFPAQAHSPEIIFVEDYEVGNEVDLNQGFYVCQLNNPRELMGLLMDIPDIRERRRFAGVHGCPYQMSEKEGPRYRIDAVLADVCLDRGPGYKLTERGREATITCGREGHQLIVTRGPIRLTVISLSMDLDLD